MSFPRLHLAFIFLTQLAQSSRAITPRTKMLIVNTPHNPVGKVFTRQELETIAALAEEFNLLVMADEVVSHFLPSLLHIFEHIN